MTVSQRRPVALIADGQCLIRMAIMEALSDLGCEALGAPDDDVALELVAQRPDISVALCEIGGPAAFDGLTLAHRIHEARPNLHLILTSGWPEAVQSAVPAGAGFIAKPYDTARLAWRMSILAA